MQKEEVKYEYGGVAKSVAITDGIFTLASLLFQFYLMYVVIQFVVTSNTQSQKVMDQQHLLLTLFLAHQSQSVNITAALQNVTVEAEHKEAFGPVELSTGGLFQTMFWSILLLATIILMVELVGCKKLFLAARNTRNPEVSGARFWGNAAIAYMFLVGICLIFYLEWLPFLIYIPIRCIFLYFVGRFIQELLTASKSTNVEMDVGGGESSSDKIVEPVETVDC